MHILRNALTTGVWGLLLLVVLAAHLYAGTTGKIAGKVVDASTGEPLLGANILVEGTTLGAATDPDGEYFIINLPPGIYTLKVRMVGYDAQAFENVRVRVDLTTRVDAKLKSSTIDLGQEITVVGKREVQKDLTSSEVTFQGDQIEKLPARDINSILSTQAGITRDAGGDLHIRGGRTSEIAYMVDGVQIINPLDRSAGISIDDQSVEELKAITGTFNAEYGQALSGVVNIVTKRGSERFTVNATGYIGDYLSFNDNIYVVNESREWAEAAATALSSKSGYIPYDFSQHGINGQWEAQWLAYSGQKPWLTREPYLNSYNPVNRYDVQLNLSGPIGDAFSYFVAGRYQNSPSAELGYRYFMPWGIWSPVSDTVHTFQAPDGELVPLGWYKGWSLQGKLFATFGGVNLSYGLYLNRDDSYGGGTRYLPDGGRYYYTDRTTHILSMTYVFSRATFLDAKGSYYTSSHENYLYEDPYDYRYVPTQAGDFQEWMFRPDRTSDIEVKTNPNDFAYWGNDVGRGWNSTRYVSASLDLTSQIGNNNMIKVGASGRFHDLENDYYSLQFSQATYRPIVPDVSSAYHTYYAAKPYELAGYVQDKIEFDELIINVGVRFDYFYSDGKILADPADPQIYAPFKMDHIYKNYTPTTPQDSLVPYTVEERAAFWYKDPDPKFQVSPRFGLSFPITAEGVIHFSYGHFFQNPAFSALYQNPNFWIAGAGSQNLVGNANLNAERTVMYEIGLQQRFSQSFLLNVTGFYRDIRDWLDTGFPVNTYSGLTYYSYVNKASAVATGLILSGALNLGNFTLNLDYTFQKAEGTASNPTDAYNDIGAGRAPQLELLSLDWDQTHQVNLIASWANEEWTATAVGAYGSGFPYTPQIPRAEATGSAAYVGWSRNSERRPPTVNVDLHVSKLFDLGAIRLRALLDVTNLLDAQNARYVYGDTGLPDYTLDDYLSRARLTEISSSTEYFASPGMYYPPRTISLGVRVTYQ